MADSFDLRRFAPPAGVTVTLASGQTYRFPGDPDTDDVARMLRLEAELDDAGGVELADRLAEAKDLVKKMATQADPGQDVDGMRIGSAELVVVFALLMHGETVAEAVAASLAPPADVADAGDGVEGDGTGVPFGPQEPAEEESKSPSPRPSSGPSSGSDAAAALRLATG